MVYFHYKGLVPVQPTCNLLYTLLDTEMMYLFSCFSIAASVRIPG